MYLPNFPFQISIQGAKRDITLSQYIYPTASFFFQLFFAFKSVSEANANVSREMHHVHYWASIINFLKHEYMNFSGSFT